jgi:hypothetical protein
MPFSGGRLIFYFSIAHLYFILKQAILRNKKFHFRFFEFFLNSLPRAAGIFDYVRRGGLKQQRVKGSRSLLFGWVKRRQGLKPRRRCRTLIFVCGGGKSPGGFYKFAPLG